ncbi:MAG: hypothetical protein IJX62_05420 [Clostridia bacterium]|nr:hypothetical protein [Clostridia bacterium]
MKDERVLAQCNLFGVLGAIPTLLELDAGARELVKDKRISLGFSVKDGPQGTLIFRDGEAEMREGVDRCSIKLYFASCKKFNDMIDGKGNPLPVSGFWHIGFLLNQFIKLTDLLSKYLRPTEEDLCDKTFFEKSTVLMLHVIAGAVAQVGNYDKVGKFSASNIVDGDILLSIAGETPVSVGVRAQNHQLTALHKAPAVGFSEMQFDSLTTARDLFDGRINAVAAVGMGKVRIGGMISQVDNVNRILDRVSLYLA